MRYLFLIVLLCFSSLAVASPEEDAQKQMEKGAKAFTQNKFSDAVLAFNRALEILPSAAGPHRELGKCYQKLNEPDRAIHHFTQYLTKRPEAEERETIEGILLELRGKLPTQGRALVSISAFPGAAVYVIALSGESQGIGVSPIQRHPVDPRFTTLRVVVVPEESKERAIQLAASLEISLSESDFPTAIVEVPIKQPESIAVLPESQPNNVTVKPIDDTTPTSPQKKSKAHLVAFGASGLGAVAFGVSGAVFLLSINSMQEQIDSLEGASVEEKQITLDTLKNNERTALLNMRIAQVGGVMAVGSAAAGLFLLRKSKKQEAGVQAIISPNQASVAVSF